MEPVLVLVSERMVEIMQRGWSPTVQVMIEKRDNLPMGATHEMIARTVDPTSRARL